MIETVLEQTVSMRRGWNKNGLPTLEKVKAPDIDSPDVVKLRD
jgi:hypothetical protein